MVTFGTAINCMDGRVQKCVSDYVTAKFGVDCVDAITMAGPCKIIAEGKSAGLVDNLKFRLDISVNRHSSRILVIAGHADCAAVEESDEIHRQFILSAVEKARQWGMPIDIIGLWVDDSWSVHEL